MWEIGNPFYLSGLAALVIPVIIHLYNRRKNKVKLMGDLSWFKEIKPALSHFRRIYQWPLFILRMLIIAVALLFLIDLHKSEINIPKASAPNLLLIHPEAGDTAQYRQLAKSWGNDSVAVHWLQKDFAQLEEPANKNYEYNLWTMIAEADFRFQPDHIHVITPNAMDLFEGNIPALNASVSWEFVEYNKDTVQLVDVIGLHDNSELYWYQSQAEYSKFIRQSEGESVFINNSVIWEQDKNIVSVQNPSTTYKVPVRNPDTLFVSGIVHDNTMKEWRLMQNVIQALSEVNNLPVSFTENSNEADWILLFDEDNIENQKSEKTKLMFTYKPIQSQQWLEMDAHESVVIRRELNTGNILEGGLFEELRPFFLNHKFKNVKLPETDYRKFELEDIPSKASKYEVKKATTKEPDSEIRLWLISFLFVLITIERIWPKKIN